MKPRYPIASVALTLVVLAYVAGRCNAPGKQDSIT